MAYVIKPSAILLLPGSERELFVNWTKNLAYASDTEHYECKWSYTTGSVDSNGKTIWKASTSTTTDLQSFYTAPSEATKVRFIVKPIPKKNKNDVAIYRSDWSNEIFYTFAEPDKVVETPPVPTISVTNYLLALQLTVEVNINFEATLARFQIYRNDEFIYYDSATNGDYIDFRTGNATHTLTATAGSRYKVRCRVHRNGVWSAWSDWSANTDSPPAAPSGITKCEATSATSIYVEWDSVDMAESYTLEWANKKTDFDGTDKVQSKTGITVNHFELADIEPGKEYFFRVKATNNKGDSAWTEIKSVVIGNGPVSPTTWSSTTTATLGETVTLYWVHNAEDNSTQSFAILELDVNGNVTTHKITGETAKWTLDTSGYTEGAKIEWRVQTAGITNEEGDWSIKRNIDVYAPPILEMSVTDSNGSSVTSLNSLPLKISAEAGPSNSVQKPVSYRISVIANDSYETEDNLGNSVVVNSGSSVYSQYINAQSENPGLLDVILSAGDLTLKNNVSYSVVCSVTMSSGLTAEARHNFTVSWEAFGYSPDASIAIDKERFTASIHPHCSKDIVTYYKVTRSTSSYTKTATTIPEPESMIPVVNGVTTTGENVYQTIIDGSTIYYCIVMNSEPVTDVLLSVYRRETDGTFTEIASDLDGTKNITVTDPHPALDYARYRIVAITKSTSEVSYTDVPGVPVGGSAIVIQWDEQWLSSERYDGESVAEVPQWYGSLIKLPYNIDTSEKTDPDVEFANYIGRSHPVGYYGTHIGETATWNTEIPKNDTDTLYGLRRLQKWMGNVYVREPSGTGYWANVKVSFNRKHKDVIIPVTIEVTRVEGGA